MAGKFVKTPTCIFFLGMVLALAAGSRGAGPTPSQPQTQPVFPSGIDVVTVDVVVLDRDGNPVEGLTRADFTVKENGQPQAMTAFEELALRESVQALRGRQRVSTNAQNPDLTGRWFFIVFDDVNVSQYSTLRARDTLVQFVDRVLRPGDHVLVASSSGGAWWTGGLPEDRDSLVAFVNGLQGAWRPDTSPARLWDHEAMGIALGRDPQALAQVARRYFENKIIPEAYPTEPTIRRDLDVSPGLGLIQVKARTAYREATDRLRTSLATLERISAALAHARGRKALLLVSEGFIMDPSQSEFRTLVQSARNSNAAVHFVDVRGPGGMVGQPGLPGGNAEFSAAVEDKDATTALAFAAREADGARSIAADTGGRVIQGANLVDGLARIAAETRAYYLLGYSPTNTRRDGAFRRIEVTVNRPDVEVRARGGYYAPSEKDLPKPPPDKLDPAVRAGLDSPFGISGIPLRLTSYVFGPQADGKVQTLLLAEANPDPLQLRVRNGTYSAVLDSYVLVRRDNGELQRDERLVELTMPPNVFERVRKTGVPIRREFSLRPGRYQATLLLRDRASGLLGSVRHEFEVPWADQFRLSTPILTDSLQSVGPGQAPQPVPIIGRTFQAGSRIFCAFDIHGGSRDARGGAPRVTLAYSLRRAGGREVAAYPPSPLKPGPLGQLPVTVALTLPDGPPGDYELHLTVRDEVAMRTVETIEPFVVEAR